MQPIILKLSEMENPKDFLSKEELNLVTGGISLSGILTCSDSSGTIMGPNCTGQTCRKGCTGGCQPGCIPSCIITAGKDGYAK